MSTSFQQDTAPLSQVSTESGEPPETKNLRKRVAALQKELNGLDAAKAKETQQQLKLLQERHIHSYLVSRRIEPGVIPGIGPALTATLAAHGLYSAADIAGVKGNQFCRTGSSYWFTMSGIGPSKSFDIQYWHQRQIAAAQSGAPQSLPKQQMKALDSKFADQRRQKQAAIDSVDPQLRQIKATVDAKYAALDKEITRKVDAIRLDYRRQRSAGDAGVAQAVTQLHGLEAAMVDAERELARYEHVSFGNYLKA